MAKFNFTGKAAGSDWSANQLRKAKTIDPTIDPSKTSHAAFVLMRAEHWLNQIKSYDTRPRKS